MTDEQTENIEEMAEVEITNNEAVTEESSTVESTDLDITTLKDELEKAKQEAQTNLDGWQRSRAEFANYKRRTSQELADSRGRGAVDALAKVMPIIDDFERALNNIPEELENHPWVSGTSLILKNMQKLMDEYDITEIDPVGEEFDPNYHEAVGMDDTDDYESGVVSMTLQKGSRSGDRVLRPALVRVAN
jgi:molecular chaperone GrpE